MMSYVQCHGNWLRCPCEVRSCQWDFRKRVMTFWETCFTGLCPPKQVVYGFIAFSMEYIFSENIIRLVFPYWSAFALIFKCQGKVAQQPEISCKPSSQIVHSQCEIRSALYCVQGQLFTRSILLSYQQSCVWVHLSSAITRTEWAVLACAEWRSRSGRTERLD